MQYIHIWYSWGECEEPVEVPNGTDAWDKMKQLAMSEVEISCLEHECAVGVLIDANAQKITLQYLYDNQECYYQISRAAHLNR